MSKLKNYVGISRDHSGSMQHLVRAALKDYNSIINNIKTSAVEEDIDTIANVIECGRSISGENRWVVSNSSVSALQEESQQI
jgi:hypothetical protein